MRLALSILILAAAIAAKAPLDAIDAHRRADAVLFPRFVAAVNEYALAHGSFEAAGHFK
jgi:hypothetical protein